MIRLVLLIAIIALLTWFLASKKTAKINAGKKIGIIIFFLFAIFTVIFPRVTDDVARLLGVGRGADLLLYFLTILFIGYVLSQYMKSKKEEQKIVLLARKIAILEANARAKE